MSHPAKAAARARLLAARAALTPTARAAAGEAIADAARGLLTVRDKPAVAAGFLSVGAEPPTAPLLTALVEAGASIIVPVLRADADLDWAPYMPGDPVAPGFKGTLAPTAATLGVEALAQADLVLVPALAVDRHGRRLGRGGGSYDRALARARPGVRTLAVVYADELLDEVPNEPHDVRVDGALTPDGLAWALPDPTS